MANLNDIAVFVKVAQLESFTRAARALGMPVSTVSRKVTSLEDQLGVTLLQRTTRRLRLTAQGRAYYDQCREPLSQLFDAESALTQTQNKPEGLLRISVPVIFAQEPFYEFLSRFLNRYPGIRADLFITNQFVDLIADNVDVAIRIGELQDSTIIAKRIGKSIRYLVASPSYLKDRTAPVTLEELANHHCILSTAGTTRRNGIWSMGENPSSCMSPARYPAATSKASAHSPTRVTVSVFCRRATASRRSEGVILFAFCQSGRRRRSSFTWSIRHVGLFRPSFRSFSTNSKYGSPHCGLP